MKIQNDVPRRKQRRNKLQSILAKANKRLKEAVMREEKGKEI
jgi:hypothetical protein